MIIKYVDKKLGEILESSICVVNLYSKNSELLIEAVVDSKAEPELIYVKTIIEIKTNSKVGGIRGNVEVKSYFNSNFTSKDFSEYYERLKNMTIKDYEERIEFNNIRDKKTFIIGTPTKYKKETLWRKIKLAGGKKCFNLSDKIEVIFIVGNYNSDSKIKDEVDLVLSCKRKGNKMIVYTDDEIIEKLIEGDLSSCENKKASDNDVEQLDGLGYL